MRGVGHLGLGRWVQLGMTSVPTITLEHLSEADRKAYIIADNAIAEKAGWSRKMLASELSGLAEIGYELELTGFDTLEIDTLLAIGDEEEPTDDDVTLPSADYVPVSRVGDLWIIDQQRLIVGDARDKAVFERLLGGERVQLIMTDPRYGCAIENNVSGNGETKHQNFVMGAGETSLVEFAMTLLRPGFRAMAACCSSGAIAFVFIDWRAAPYLLDAAQGVFYETKQMIVGPKRTGDKEHSTGPPMS